MDEEVEIPSRFSDVVGLLDPFLILDIGVQYFDSNCSAIFLLFTIGDLKAVTTASQEGGGSTAVSNQCFNTSHTRSVRSE